MQTVFVVQGNDYAEAVFATKELAEAFIKEKKKEEAKGFRRIHWHWYKFDVRTE